MKKKLSLMVGMRFGGLGKGGKLMIISVTKYVDCFRTKCTFTSLIYNIYMYMCIYINVRLNR